MSTQYNTIQGPYDYIRKLTIAYIEHDNVETAVAPYTKGARVLELACGSGFYTYSFLKWGAKSVVGVDISSAMIEENRRQGGATTFSPGDPTGPINFVVADCMKPSSYKGGPFDLVFGAWLLNYAPNRAALVDMFRNISLNLKDGGHFVGITIIPANDPLASIKAEAKVRPPPDGSGGLNYRFLNDVDDGIYFTCYGDTPLGEVSFDNYYLKEDVYRGAAKEAGMKGVVSWGVTSVPETYLKGEGPGGSSMEEIESYQKIPNYGIIVVAK
ncbi:MAG: hypothetical protein Q9160_001223 [Pyrenula sp. 1 TL-2023]